MMLRSAFPANAFARTILFGALLALGFFVCAAPHANAQDAQTDETYQAERKRAFALYEQNRMTDAAPLLEALAQKNPNDVMVLSRLGFALYSSSAAIKEPNLKRQARQRAREILLRAKELGDNSDLTQTVLNSLASNESGETSFSARQQADAAMK